MEQPFDSPLRSYFEALLLLLLASGFYTLAMTGRLGAPVVLGVTCAFLLRGVLLTRGLRPRIPPRILLIFTLGYIVIYAADVFLLDSGFLVSTLHLVVFVGVVKLFSAETARDYVYLCIIAFMEVLSAATLTVSGSFFGFFILFLALMVATFVAYEVFRSQENASLIAPLPDWRGRIANSDPRADPSAMVKGNLYTPLGRSLFKFSFILSLGVVVFSLLLFMMLPRTSIDAWGGSGGSGQPLVGFSDEVRLGEVADLQESDQAMMHVRVAGSNPRMAAWQLDQTLLRGRALTQFDGRRWFSLASPRPLITDNGHTAFHDRSSAYPAQILQYQVTLEPIGSPVLFFPSTLLQTNTRFAQLTWDRFTDTIASPGHEFSTTSYSGVSDLGRPSDQVLEDSPAPSRRYVQRYGPFFLQLPPALDPRIRALAVSVTAGRTNNWDRMQALTNYLKSNYGYTIENLPLGPDPLAEFLFNKRAGDCEYFASALAVMARSLGIPTRMVDGFRLGQFNNLSNEYVVRGRDAHAWVEAYFPPPDADPWQGNWITFDATPASQVVSGGLFSRASLMFDAISSIWQEWVINYDFMHQTELAHRVQASVSDHAQSIWDNWKNAMANAASYLARWATAVVRWVQNAVHSLWMWVCLLLLLLLFYVLRRNGIHGPAWRRMGWFHPRDSRDYIELGARRQYRRFQQALRRAGYERRPSQTAGELVASLPTAEVRQPASEFVRLYERLRFGPPSDGVAGLTRLGDSLRTFRRALAHAPRA